MSLNPHDRRRTLIEQRQEADEMARIAESWHQHLQGGPAAPVAGLLRPQYQRPAVLTIEDLEAIAYRHRQEGLAEGRASRDEELLAGQRQAWDDGFTAGSQHGHHGLLEQIDELVGGRVRDAVAAGEALLRELEGKDHGEVDAGDLVPMLTEQARLLRHLLELHHAGFGE